MAAWLFGTAGAVAAMISLGAVTRLTRSGLSMTTWRPLGSRPPSTTEEWQAEFDQYKQFPEFTRTNSAMTLDEFKAIYLMEWTHRAWGRGLGIVFGVPLAFFVLSGRSKAVGLTKPLLGLLGVGAFQGGVGWWMVRSGLDKEKYASERYKYDHPRVAPTRLAFHLTTACVTYSGLLWAGWTALSPNRRRFAAIPKGSMATAAVVGVTMLSGAFVAGNDAGRAFNDWPLFAGDLVPYDLYRDDWTLWENLTESTGTVQFNHRTLAYTSLASVSMLALSARKGGAVDPATSRWLTGAAALVWGQATLGIVTLMTYVPTSLGVAHQFGAVSLWSALLGFHHSLRYAPK